MSPENLAALATLSARLLADRYPGARCCGLMLVRLPVRWTLLIAGVRPDDTTMTFASTTDLAPQATYDDALAAFLRDCASLE